MWDLEVADDWLPRAADGEVERFERWSMQRLEHEVREGELLRPAMRLVMTDFLIRHGTEWRDIDSHGIDAEQVWRKWGRWCSDML